MPYKETNPAHIMPQHEPVTTEDINKFFEGADPMQHIIDIELSYNDADAEIVFINDIGEKRIRKEPFKPFTWAKNSACIRMFGGQRGLLRSKMREYGIRVKALYTCTEDNPYPHEKLDNGYKYLFYSTHKMSMGKFQNFFNEAGTPLKPKKQNDTDPSSQEFMYLQPVEQFMIETGKRYFKGYDNYDDLTRMSFDLETEGLNPKIHAISQIGVRTNKGFERILTITGADKPEKEKNEMLAIIEFLEIISTEKPDVIFGHNTENFDWDFIITRCSIHGYDFQTLSSKFLREGIYKQKRPTTLKLGGEVETYFATQIKYHNVVDSLHAVRRAMATNSSFESANLKYATKFLKLNKKNRVYVPGNLIDTTWLITDKNFAFNDTNGDWYKISDSNPLKDGYELVSGRYIVERYLLDDIWEADKVELALHETDFQLTKIMPTTFMRVCTMGTATQWKLIMLTWAYQHNLAIPTLSPNRKFTGGLSRLLLTGYMNNIFKADFNSLYPSTILTWNITCSTDIMGVMLKMLRYVLTQREYYKGLKKKAANKAEELYHQLKAMDKLDPEYASLSEQRRGYLADKINNDNQQLIFKKLGNSFFGSFGCPSVFNFADLDAAEKTTCLGRMQLRIMIAYFHTIGEKYFPSLSKEEQQKYNYIPIVGDTDGFDFKLPEKYRYTEDNPYIGKGLNRESKLGKKYIGNEADVAEFNDTLLSKTYNGAEENLSGLGIDEYVTASINIARKNYLCLMEEDGSIKKVGNTMKSRKMSGYLQKFINNACDMLIQGDGYGFLNEYYNYIDDIYNYRIPVRDIASKGNIKKELSAYKEDCATTTKSGAKKSRQAWYELALSNNMNVHQGDTVYYVNTGQKKSDSDVKRITHKFINDPNNPNETIELTTRLQTQLIKQECEKEQIEYKTLKAKDIKARIAKYVVREEDEILLNCKVVPHEIIDNEKELLCSDVPELEYNVVKYIEQFNKRIHPLLVCFDKSIRDQIIIDNPENRKYWTKEQAVLVFGQPMKDGDQDTYEALMTPERKEIEFWTRIGERPPFLEECGIDWDDLVKQYQENIEKEATELFQAENAKYLLALNQLNKDDIDAFYDEGKLPKSITDIVTLNPIDMKFYFKSIPNMTPSTGGYIFDDIKLDMSEHGIEIEKTSSFDI